MASAPLDPHQNASGAAGGLPVCDQHAILAASERRHREIFANVPLPAWLVDAESLQCLQVNAAAISQYGFSEQEFLRMRITDLLSKEDQVAFCQSIADVRSGVRLPGPWRHLRPGHPAIQVELTWTPFTSDNRPAALVLATDVTDRTRADKRAMVFSDLGQRLSAARTPKEAAQAIMGAADLLFGWDACLFGLCSPDKLKLSTVLAVDTIKGKRTEVAVEDGSPGPITLEALKDGERLVLRSSAEVTGSPDNRWGDKARSSRSVMAVRVLDKDKTIGVLSAHSYSPNAYTSRDLQTFKSLADHCAGALDRIRAEQEIDRLNRELRGRLEELQTLFEVAPVGIAVAHDPNCRSVSLNAACAAIMGLSQAEDLSAIGFATENLPFRITKEGKDLPPKDLPMRLAARENVVVPGQELEIVLPDGRTVDCYSCASPLYDDAERVRGSLGVFVDLTQRKSAEKEILRLNAELERRVRDRTRQLEAINRELEAFSYSVSHDLRAPLRGIRGFSEVLLERYGEQLDARGQEFLNRACESCAHMDRLIDDLLKLSRVGRSELQRSHVDLSAMAESLVSELRQAEPKRHVEVVIAPGMSAFADERLVRVALDNVLRNAWKFTRDQPRPKIQFSQIDEPEGMRTFFVRDNGAGFDMAYASKLFGVFQRLHTASEFPGTGIGLATFQRIINRHGGRVWAMGAVNDGATFYFTLPNESDT